MFRPDPGEVFESDAHRAVLAHLSLPTEDYGWDETALALRSAPALVARGATLGDLPDILQSLKDDGYASSNRGVAWRMTKKGFELLNGPIANEPDPAAAATAALVSSSPAVGAATPLKGHAR